MGRGRSQPRMSGAPASTATRVSLRAPSRPADLEPAGDTPIAFAAAVHAAGEQSPDLVAKRVELILQQLDCLPTLSTVAVRVLELTDDDASQGQEIVKLVASDPALAAKVLRMCRCSERGRALDVTTVERAVLMLGFDALRSAVLSVQIFDIFDTMPSPGGEQREHGTTAGAAFDRLTFWRHSLAAGSLCEMLAGTAGACSRVIKADAFLSGLLHDLGALALHVLLPQSFDRACRLAETYGASIDHACRQLIGLDTHTVGRRLAEHWRLPHSLGDVMWLHGQRLESLPDFPHRAQIALVTLADAVARSLSIAPAGHGPRDEDIRTLARDLDIAYETVEKLSATLHQEVAARQAMLGLGAPEPGPAILLQSISRANQALGRLNSGMRQRSVLAQRLGETLAAITQFHDSAAPGDSVVSVMGMVVQSAVKRFGGSFFAVLYQGRPGDHWQLTQFSSDGRPVRSELLAPPPACAAVDDLSDNTQLSMHTLGLLPWVADYLGDARDLRDVQLLPLRCGWGVNAVLMHDCQMDGREGREQLDALGRTWAAAIAAGAKHEGAKRLGEQLAESNRALIEAQRELARKQALASLGEIAAGAAHEMNNPLTVISGRSQLLASTLTDSGARAMAEQIVEQSHRISDMITALRMFAEPTRPDKREVDLGELFRRVVSDVSARYAETPPIKVVMPQPLPAALVDPAHLRHAIGELVRNAIESEGSRHIELRAEIDPVDGRLRIQVTDDGSGLTQHALTHAFDPFFSAKAAGRQPGLGLPQARRLIEAHGGQVTLENGRSKGAVATIRLSDWRAPAAAQREVA